jgi:hypothetical protein
MRIVAVFILTHVALACFSQSRETFHLIQYDAPSGWTYTSTEPVRQYTLANGNAYCVITLYPSMPAATQELDDFWQEWTGRVLAMGTTQNTVKPMSGVTAQGIKYVEGGANLLLKDGINNVYAHLVVLRIGAMRQSIVYGSATQFMTTLYQQPLSGFFASLSQAEIQATASPVQGTQKIITVGESPGSVTSNNGTFYHGSEAVFVGPSTGNKPVYLYLFPDNHFQWGYYQRGYFNYNRSQELQTTPSFCGTYTRNGNNIRLNFADNSGYHPEYTVDAKGNLQSHSNNYMLIKFPGITSKQLKGTYTADAYGVTPPQATFYLNGRFEDNALLCMGLQVDYSLPLDQADRLSAENRIPGTGNYRIVDHSLILNYDDGRNRQLLLYIYEEEAGKPSPRLMMLTGVALKLVKE